MYTAKIAGLDLHFSSFKDLAEHYDRLAKDELSKGTAAATIKEQRFHQGKCLAYQDVASLLKTIEVNRGHNPLLDFFKAIQDNPISETIKSHEDMEKRDNLLDEVRRKAMSQADHRLPKIIFKAAATHEASYNEVDERYDLSEDEAAAQFTSDPFEAVLVGLAFHWFNDLHEAAGDALGLPPCPTNDELAKAWHNEHVKPILEER